MNNGDEEVFHDARSAPSPSRNNVPQTATAAAFDPTAIIRPQFGSMNIDPNVQFSIGTSDPADMKKKGSPGKLKARRHRTSRPAAAPVATEPQK
ncbi:MAG: hypothetical protein SGARI_006030, partial [Bacillariaceae sp.]